MNEASKEIKKKVNWQWENSHEELVSYSMIKLDDDHEQTIHTNVLFGLLKGLVK